jgi:hypothetical protein
MNKIDVAALTYRADTVRKSGRVFMKELVTGKYITLYFQSDDTKIRYIINDASTNGPVELMYYRFTNDNSEVTNAALYKAQLKLHIGKYYHKGEFDEDIKNAAFEQIDLAELIKKVNAASALSANLKTALRFFAGPAFNSTTVNATGINQINSPQSVTVASPRINAGADIIFTPEIQQLILRLEFSFSYIQPKFAFKADPGYSVPSTSDVHYTLNQYTTTFTPQFIVNVYNTKPLKVYLDGGFGFNFSSYSGQHLSVTNTSEFGTVLHNDYDKPYTLNPFWLSVPFQAGVVFSKFEIHASYMFKANYSQHKTGDNVMNINNQTISAGVNYLF